MDSERKAALRKKFKVFSAIFKMLLFLVIIVGIPLYLYFFQKDLIQSFSSMENVRALFNQYKAQSVLFYLLGQVLQIVICVIPGQWLQFTAGYMWGFWLGYLYSLIGALIGSVLTYGARCYASDLWRRENQEVAETLEQQKSCHYRILHLPDPGRTEGSLQLCGRTF